MEMGDQPLHDVGKTFIISLGIYNDSVFSDIVNIEILHRRYFDVFRIHTEGFIVVLRSARVRKYLYRNPGRRSFK
jgi:hypothetical protein